jgi:hypothetical protein
MVNIWSQVTIAYWFGARSITRDLVLLRSGLEGCVHCVLMPHCVKYHKMHIPYADVRMWPHGDLAHSNYI